MIDDVTFDDTGVRRVSPEGGIVAIRWVDLVEVRIVTTAEGPFTEDVRWLLVGADGAEVAVQESSVTPDLLDRLQALPGFDHEQMSLAMRSTDKAQFVCWRTRS